MEWVKVTHDGRTVQCYVAYPEVKTKATAVVVIHEIFGLTEWVRGVTDQLAEAGYIAIAPDLLSGSAPGGGGTAELGGGDAVRKAISGLPPEQVQKGSSFYGFKLLPSSCWTGGATRWRSASSHGAPCR